MQERTEARLRCWQRIYEAQDLSKLLLNKLMKCVKKIREQGKEVDEDVTSLMGGLNL